MDDLSNRLNVSTGQIEWTKNTNDLQFFSFSLIKIQETNPYFNFPHVIGALGGGNFMFSRYDSMAPAISSNRFKSIRLFDFLLWSMSPIFRSVCGDFSLRFIRDARISVFKFHWIQMNVNCDAILFDILQCWTKLNGMQITEKVLRFSVCGTMTKWHLSKCSKEKH